MYDYWAALDSITMDPPIKNRRRSFSMWAGEAGLSVDVDGRMVRYGTCRRKMYYRYKNYAPDSWGVGFAAKMKMDFGNWVSDRMVDGMKMLGLYRDHETNVMIIREGEEFGRYSITGRIDILVRDPELKKPVIIEVKTTGGFMEAGCIKPTKNKPLMPRVEHVLQTMPYMDWLQMPKQGVKNPQAVLMYMSRDGNRSSHWISFAGDGSVVINNVAGRYTWPHISLGAMYADYDSRAVSLVKNEVPARDYELRYSRDTVIWKLEHNEFSERDAKAAQKALNDSDAEFPIDDGDFDCAYCDFQKLCYGMRPDEGPIPEDVSSTFNEPTAEPGGALETPKVHIPD